MPEPISQNEALVQLFEAHGVTANFDGEWIAFPGRSLRAQATTFLQNPKPGGVSVQLDFLLVLRPAQVLAESCAGIGQTEEEAIRDGLRAFAANSLHAILAALFELPSDQVQVESWTIAAQERKVTLGNVGVRGRLPEGLMPKVFEPLCELVKNSALPPGLHWVRLYYAQGQGKAFVREALLDNQAWEEAADAMARLPWTPSPDFYSVRLFLIVQGGIGAAEALEVFCNSPGMDDEAITEELARQGVEDVRAALLAAFIPLAFGRAVLATAAVHVAPTAILRDADTGVQQEIILAEQPIYAEASRLAKSARMFGAMAGDDFERVVMRSPEINAMNQALSAGHKPNGWKFAPPVIAFSRAAAASSPAENKPEKERRPFWKLWGR